MKYRKLDKRKATGVEISLFREDNDMFVMSVSIEISHGKEENYETICLFNKELGFFGNAIPILDEFFVRDFGERLGQKIVFAVGDYLNSNRLAGPKAA